MTDWTPPERSENGPTNVRPRRVQPMHGDESWLNVYWYESPGESPALPDVYTYTDAMSYAPGEEVKFHSSTTAAVWSLEVYRDGWRAEPVHVARDLPGQFSAMPKDAYTAGCGWPVRHKWRLPADLRSGFYRVVSTCARPGGGRFLQHHFFVVRPAAPTRSGKLLMLLPTSTWMAYNDWGGANHYQGTAGPDSTLPCPRLSAERPWCKGIVWLPEGAPRTMSELAPELGDAPYYPSKEWAYASGFSYYYASAGWAQYDRHFVRWAEREGYALDMITQIDLHYRPQILDDYACVVIVGHDEYWSWEMREALEAFTERGGKVARFGANFLWQIRLENDGRMQVCHKFRSGTEDPVRGTAASRRLTTIWEALEVGWPGASTVGVNGVEGLYASWGGFLPRGQKGFTVYRPEHWVFRNTGLGYGDIFGAEARMFGYEVDGLDYTFHDGLPYPTGRDGAATDIEILAMAPAVLGEAARHGEGFQAYLGDRDMNDFVRLMTGGVEQSAVERYRYGAGMLVHMARGKGEVVCGASCEWVMGLKRREPFTERITRNVLDRFLEG